MEGARAKLTDVNPHLVCVLCHGYFVDATTIAECLHSFCRSCIFRHLERKPICPICEVAVLNTKLHIALRPDKTLQDIVYKLVPGLYRNEMQRRREFYKQHPYRDEHLEPECRGVGLDRVIYSPDDLISISLEFYDDDREREEWNNNNVIQKPVPIKKSPPGSKRYLQGPANFKIKHLKKFIRQKCGLADTCEVEVIYRKESLPDNYSLMDIAYIYTWKRNEPIRFYYKLPMKMLEAAKALASHKIVKEPAQIESQGEAEKIEEATKNDKLHQEKVTSSAIGATVHVDPVENCNHKKTKTKPAKPLSLSDVGTGKTPAVSVRANGLLKPLTEIQSEFSPKEIPLNSPTPTPQPQKPVVVCQADVAASTTAPTTTVVTPAPTLATSTSKPIMTPPPKQMSVTTANHTNPVPNQMNPPPVPSPTSVQKAEKFNSELAVPPRTMTKQDELPVSVLLSLGNCTPEIKRPVDKLLGKPESKFCQILPKPDQKPVPIVDQLLTKKMMNSKTNSKVSVNKIASELAENKTSNKKVFKTPAPFSSNPLMLKTFPKSTMQKLADQAPGNRTPFHHTQLDSPANRTPYHRPMPDPTPGNRAPFHQAQSPQHLPVYPPPMMPAITKTVPWKEAAKSRTLFPQSPRHIPQYPFALPKEPKQSTENKKASQDPFLFSPSEGDSQKPDGNERVSQNGVGNTPPPAAKQSSRASPPGVQNTIPSIPNGVVHQGNQKGITSHKTERPEVTVKTSNGSLTISTQPPQTTNSNEPVEVQNDKLPQPPVMNKNISDQQLNGNGFITSGPKNENKLGFENKPRMNLESKVESELKNTTSPAGNKNLSLSRKNHSTNGLIPGGVVSKTGPTLDQRLQQLYKSNSRQQPNGVVPAQKAQPLTTGKLPQQSRLASWLNNRFNAQNKPPSPVSDKTVKTPENKDKHGQESATAKLGKEVSMLKKKLDELRKNAEGCEITQENPTPDAVKKIRDVTPNVSIEFMKAADMKKLENTTKTKEKGLKRPVPGLKAIQDVDVKKIKLSPEEEDAKKAKLDKKGDEALDLSGAGKPSDELAHRISLLQKNGALSNQQQFNWLLNRPLVAGQQFLPRSS